MDSPKNYEIQIVNNGEYRMGSFIFGVIVKSQSGWIKTLSGTMVAMTGGEDPNLRLQESDDDRYLLIEGIWATYVIDLQESTVSIYDIQINHHRVSGVGADKHNIWTKECAILGADSRRITAKDKKFYFVQFPFCGPDDDFHGLVKKYEQMRIEQIRKMKNWPPPLPG
ncbi:MAG: hypothetical protein AAGA25_01275 [Planctomycetota bacterium]